MTQVVLFHHVQGLPPGVVAFADQLRGALFFHSCLPVSEFGSRWPKGVPLQIHAMDSDPFFVNDGDIDAARALLEEAEQAEMFLYPGDQHLFTDSSLPSYDAEATDLLMERVLKFLAEDRVFNQDKPDEAGLGAKRPVVRRQ